MKITSKYLFLIFLILNNFFSYASDINKTINNETQVITEINFIGLKKTQDFYIKSKVREYIGQKLDEKLIHNLETTLQLEGLFDEIKISSKSQSEEQVILNINVKEKITFLPLPFAMYSSSGFIVGGIVMDTNAFGIKDMFMVGGMYSNSIKMGMASYSKAPKKNGKPGFSAFIATSKNNPELKNTEDEIILEYENLSFESSIAVIQNLGRNHTFAMGLEFKNINASDKNGYSDLIDSAKIGLINVSFGYSKSDWNGWFMSSVSSRIKGEFGLTDLKESDLKYPQIYSAELSIQKPIVPRLRFYGSASIHYGIDNHISLYSGKSGAAVNILPAEFSSQRLGGGNSGFEIALVKMGFGLLSIYGDYQIAYVQEFDKEYEFIHGPNSGVRLYLSKIAFPALAMGLSYNVTKKYSQFAIAMGMSF